MRTLDFESIRHRVKLIRDAGAEQLYENRDGVPCPVCAEPFDEALTTTERTCELSPTRVIDVCIVRESDRVDIFTHAREA